MADEALAIEAGGRSVPLSRPDKVLFPEAGLTKADLARYLARIAPCLLPHARGRFLTLRRFPDGLDADGFFQQSRPDHFPDGVRGVRAPRVGGGEVTHIVVDDAAGLVFLADQGTLELHGWFSPAARPRCPDRLVVDLDPADEDVARLRDAARWTGDLLRELGLTPFVMTTGSRGLHVVVPLTGDAGFDAARTFARDVADTLVARHPDTLTVAQRKADRAGRLYLDVTRLAYGQTSVLPYSPRARPGAPIAAPLHWHELDADLDPQGTTITNVFRRLGQTDDPWAAFHDHATDLDAARDALDALQG